MDRIHIIFFSVSIGITYIGMGCRVPKIFSENYVDRVHIIYFLFLLDSPLYQKHLNKYKF